MRGHLGVLLVTWGFLSVPTSAQDNAPKVEIFGGYSYANIDNDSIPSRLSFRENAHGWGASLSGNFHKNFGFTLDFAGQYGSGTISASQSPSADFQSNQFLFGPRFTLRGGSATGFVHALFGVARTRISSFTSRGTRFPSNSDIDFSMAYGGGLDINVGERIAIRAFQADYIPVRFSEEFPFQRWLSNFRVQTGIVIKFGSL